MSDATKNLPVTWDSGSHSIGTVKTGIATLREGVLVARETTNGTLDHGGDDTGIRFAGVSLEEGEADKTMRVRTIGVYGPYAYGPGDADDSMIGSEVTLVDDQTVSVAGVTTNDVVCGTIFAVDSVSLVRIKIEGYAKG